MKKVSVFLLFILVSFALTAQEEDNFETIFGPGTTFSGFGGPWMNFTTVNGEFAHMMGGGGGVLLNNAFYFGGYGYGVTNSISYQGESMDFGYGGLTAGYILNGNRAIHPMLGFQMGWGDISIKELGINDQVYVLTPIVEMEINMTRFFKIGLGAGYRYVTGVDQVGTLENKDFSGFSGRLSFYFGWF